MPEIVPPLPPAPPRPPAPPFAETRPLPAPVHSDYGADHPQTLRIFSGTSNPDLSHRIAGQIGLPLGQLHISRFADGEIRVKIEESVRGMDVFIVQPTCAPVNDHVMELLILVDAFRRASARRITLVMPYYGYSRQDKKIKPREPVSARLVADLITTAGAHRILAVDLHAGQIQGFFQIPLDHLYAGPLISTYFAERGLTNHDTVVVSPDVGGVARARGLAETLKAPIAIIAKRRPEPNQVEIMEIIGDVSGKTCVMIDDLIDTGGSIVSGAEALIARGARRVYACCTHPVLSGSAVDKIEGSPITELVVTDTIPLDPQKRARSTKLRVISVASLLANAICRIHTDDSVSEMFDSYW
jgi:ribose-phosphate pyrophosphokinase